METSDEHPKTKRKRRARPHGQGSVYQRGRLFSIKWRERGEVRYSHGHASRDFALQVLATIMGNIAAGRVGLPDPDAPQPGDVTFDAIADKWLASRGHHRTVNDEKLRLKKHLRPVFGPKRLREITTAEIDKFLTGKLTEEGKAKLAPATVWQLRFILGRIYADAIRWDLAATSPVARSKSVKVPRDDERFEYLTKAEIEQLLTCAEIPFGARALYATAMLAGLRMGELYCLQWGDVDLERRQLAVRRSFKGPTKSGKPRFVPIHPQLATTLAQWKRARDPEPTAGDVVFPNKKGERRSRFHDYGFKAHLVTAKCKTIRFHDLRHTAASFYVSQGTPLRTVQAILGHASITTTERYAHLAPGYAQADVDRTRLDLARGQVVSITTGEAVG